MRVIIVQALLVFLLSLNLAAGSSLAATGTEVMEEMGFHIFRAMPEAHNFDMHKVDGSPLRLGDLKGKVVLLNFWRKNCHYCSTEKELLRKMVKRLKSDDLTVLCVNLWDTPRWVSRYASKDGNEFLYATRGKSGRSFAENEIRGRLMGYYIINSANEAVYEVKGFPTTYVIDKDGKVVAGHLGMARWDDPAVSQWIGQLVGPATRRTVRAAKPAGAVQARDALPGWLNALLAGPMAER